MSRKHPATKVKGKVDPSPAGASPMPPSPAPGAVSQRHLLIVAISPVQRFIAAARRMRDLAYGSQLLSDLGEALADELEKNHRADLVFPARGGQAAAGTARNTNKIMCLLPRAKSPADVSKALHKVFEQQLAAVGEACLAALQNCREDLAAAVMIDSFRTQITSNLQLFCAWAQVRGETPNDYAAAYRLAHSLLDARKGLRNFRPPAARPGWQLSSLDGERDSVLADGHLPLPRASAASTPQQRAAVARLRKRYQIDGGEQLDAMGLAKRVLGTEVKFPALIRIAFQPWVAQWARNEALPNGTEPALPRLSDIQAQTRVLEGHGLARRNGLKRGEGIAAELPYDGEMWLASRRAVARRRDPGTAQPPHDPAALNALAALDNCLHHEPACAGEEGIYVAVLVADGDRMGSVILDEAAKLSPPAQCHRSIATALQAIADAAVDTVCTHGGHALYAGGDDLLAVLPVQNALTCAEALRKAYASTLGAALPDGLKPSATLSVGIGIGHVIEPMGRLLALAQQACQLAKDGPDGQGLRNALGLAIQPRSGNCVQIARQWDTDGGAATAPAGLVKRLERWRDAFADGSVSGSLPYDLVRLVDEEPMDALIGATQRLFKRRGLDHDHAKALRDDIQAHWRRAKQAEVGGQAAARTLADELYLCRWLGAHPRPTTGPQAAHETPSAPAQAPSDPDVALPATMLAVEPPPNAWDTP